MSVTVKVSANFDRWIRGFAHLEAESVAAAAVAFHAANEVFFDRSQSNAHVLSGRMKASGKAETAIGAGEVKSTLTYDAPYAIYEEQRGGSHAYIGRAWEQTEQLFSRAMPEAWEKVVATWR